MKISELIRWPAKKTNNMIPWYQIIRRSALILPVKVLLSMTWIVIAFGWGLKDANRWWRDAS